MLLGFIALALVGVIAYWHYLQGFFSAGISAVLAIIAAVFAVGYHESLVSALLGGKLADYAHAIALVCIFAAVYLALRLIFDSLVPGNVRFPVLVEKIGAGFMGVVAGVFAVGVVIIAAQTLPFGPGVAYYDRYPMTYGKQITIAKGPNQSETDAYVDELNSGAAFTKNEAQKLFFPVDEWVLATVSHVSGESGSLWNDKPFDRYHPDYLQELFGQRVGIQTGSNHCALEGKTEVIGLYMATALSEVYDPERGHTQNSASGIRARDQKAVATGAPMKPSKLGDDRKAPSGSVFLIVRARFHLDDTDKGTNLFSFTPAGIRICDGRKNYFPIGTLEYPGKKDQPAIVFYQNEPDDAMFVSGGKAADLVYEVPDSMLSKSGTNRAVASDVFLEVKRLAHVELSGKPVGSLQKAQADEAQQKVVQIKRKGGLPAKADESEKADEGGLGFTPNLEGTWRTADGQVEVQFTSNRFTVKRPAPSETVQGMWSHERTDGAMYYIKWMLKPPAGESVRIMFQSADYIIFKLPDDAADKGFQRAGR